MFAVETSEERAIKAARAKEKLKRFQAAKTGAVTKPTTTTTSLTSDVHHSSPTSLDRALSPPSTATTAISPPSSASSLFASPPRATPASDAVHTTFIPPSTSRERQSWAPVRSPPLRPLDHTGSLRSSSSPSFLTGSSNVPPPPNPSAAFKSATLPPPLVPASIRSPPLSPGFDPSSQPKSPIQSSNLGASFEPNPPSQQQQQQPPYSVSSPSTASTRASSKTDEQLQRRIDQLDQEKQHLTRKVQELEASVVEHKKCEHDERTRQEEQINVEEKAAEQDKTAKIENEPSRQEWIRELEQLQRSHSELEQALSSRDDEARSLRTELNNVKHASRTTLEDEQRRLQQLQAELDELRSSFSETRQGSSRDLEAARKLATKVQAELIDRTQHVERLSHELMETKARLAESEAHITSLEAELDELSASTSDQLASLRDELTYTKTRSTSLEQTLSSFEIKLSALSSHRDELQLENASLQSSLEDARRSKASLVMNDKTTPLDDNETVSSSRTLSATRLELERLRETAIEADSLREELDGLQDQLGELVEDGEKAQQELIEANEMIRSIENERNEVQTRVVELEKEVEGFKQREVAVLEGSLRVDEVERRLKELEEQYRFKVEQVEALKKEIEDAQIRYVELETTKDRTTQQLRAEHEQVLNDLKTEHERLTKELESEHERVVASTRQEHALALEALECEKQSRTNDEAQSRLTSLEQELADAKAHAAQLVSQGGQALADLERQTSELSLMQSERDAANHRAEAAETRFGQLRSELEEARSEAQVVSPAAALSSAVPPLEFPFGSDSSEREQLLLTKITELEAELVEARRASDQSVSHIASQIGTINKLRREHTELVSQYTAEAKRVTELRKMIEKKDFDSSRMGQDIVRLRTELASAKADTESSNRARRTIEQTLNVTRATYAGLERQVGEARALQVAAEASVEPLQETIEAYEVDLDQKQERIGELEDEVAMYVKRVNELEFSMDAVAKKSAASEFKSSDLVEVLENERASHAQALSEMVSSLNEVRTELNHARSSLESTTIGTAEVDSLKARISELETTLHLTSTDLATSQRDLESTQRDLARLNKSNADLEATNVRLSESLPIATPEEMDRLKADLETVRGELARAQGQRRELEEELRDAKHEFAKARIEVEKAQKESSEALELRSSLEGRIGELETSLETLQAAYDEQTTTVSTLETEISKLRSTLSERETDLLTLRSELYSTTSSTGMAVRERDVALNAAVRRASKSERELKSLIASGDERLGELETLRTLVTSLQEELASLRSGSEGTSGQVASLTEEVERNVEEVERLRRLWETEKEATSEARNALGDLKEALAKAEDELEMKNIELGGLRRRVSTSEGENAQGGSPKVGDYDREQSECKYFASYAPRHSLADCILFAHSSVDALQQQAELSLSSARAQIRSLEQRLFEEEDARYELEKINGDLKLQVQGITEMIEDDEVRIRELEHLLGADDHADSEYGHDRPPHLDPTDFDEPLNSPPTTSIPSASNRGPRAGSHRRAPSLLTPVQETSELSSSLLSPPNTFLPLPAQHSSFNAPVSPPLVSVSTPILDGTMSPSTSKRHVRQTSLSLLKSRLEEELGPDALLPNSPLDGPPTTTNASLIPVLSTSTTSLRTSTTKAVLQDNLVWCACCQGDLFMV
ncbi:BQ2448_3307 [Microbotryum intermedium]|uniref:BQ2448_3307 protein n=1 Tax=Microbotryum intermedium TaxID=269621 RepID=A0A238FBH2_9BASI|nr:BQ2448_3307 [Microbotryum intermedium]